MHALKTLKFDGTCQKIPVTNLHTEINYKVTSGDNSDVKPRFDWVSVKFNAREDLSQVQLLAILEAKFPKKHNKEEYGTVFLYIAADIFVRPKTRPNRYLYVYTSLNIRIYV
jgi:hypothetical protein